MFDYYVTYTIVNEEYLPMTSYRQGEMFEKEDKQSKEEQKEAFSKMCSSHSQLRQKCLKGDPIVGTLGEPYGKFNYYLTYTAPKVKCLLISNYRQGEEFEEEDGQGKK